MKLVVYEVLSEDPLVTRKLSEQKFQDYDAALEAFQKKIDELDREGYMCSEHVDAYHFMCCKVIGDLDNPRFHKLLVVLEMEKEDEDKVLSWLEEMARRM